MFPTDYIIFLQIILFLFISPGPPRVVIVSHTLNYGLNRSVWTAFGDISANTIQAILVVFLIGSFLSDNPQVLYYLKWAGIFYIVYLAYDTFNSKIKNCGKIIEPKLIKVGKIEPKNKIAFGLKPATNNPSL